MIIAVEGINGIGKTTLVDRLSTLDDFGPFVRLCDPGVHPSHKAYTAIRPLATREEWQHPLTRFTLFMAARCELADEARRLAAAGDVVFLDRYLLSCYVYQSADFGNDVGRLARVVDAYQFPEPDLTILLHGSADLALRRSRTDGDGPDVFESMGVRALDNLQAQYMAYADLGLPGVGRVEKVSVDPDDTAASVFLRAYAPIERLFTEKL